MVEHKSEYRNKTKKRGIQKYSGTKSEEDRAEYIIKVK